MTQRIFSKLLLTYVIIILLTLLVVGIFLSQLFQNYYFNLRQQELMGKGQEISNVLVDHMLGLHDDRTANDLIMLLDKFLDARVTPLDRESIIVETAGDSDELGLGLEREQIEALLEGHIVTNEGDHPIFRPHMITVGVPILLFDEVVGAIFLQATMDAITPTISMVQRLILIAAMAAIVLSTIVGFYISKSISSPLQQMNEAALEIAQGNFAKGVAVSTRDEVGQLANTFNYMTTTLSDTVTALSQEKNKIESIMVSMSEGVIAFDIRGRVLLVNPQAKTLLNLEGLHLEDKHISEVLTDKSLEEYLLSPVYDSESKVEEFTINDSIIMRAQASPLRSNNEIWGTVGVLQDVTEVRQLEQMRKDFVANVSHELRTPLTSIQGFVEALQDGMAEDDEAKDRYLNIIQEESRRLSRLIEDLLDLSRLEKGKIKINAQTIDLREVINHVAARFKPQVQNNNLNFAVELPREQVLIYGDRDRLEQVLVNLVSNAINYTPTGQQVSIRCKVENDKARIMVIDTGVGITEAEQEKIWERFYKVDKARTTSATTGTGLGLSIVKQIVEAHGGTVAIESKSGVGSCFSFELPLQ